MDWTGKTKITHVDTTQEGGVAISFGENSFFLQDGQNLNKIVPKVGDTIEVKVHNNTFVSGVRINGEVAFDLTPEELKVEAERVTTEINRQRREIFEQNQAQLDADYETFPKEFKDRMDRFRRTNPDFRWKYEMYEAAITKAAVAIAKKYPTEDGIVAYKKLPFEKQLDSVPEVFDFSGNMVGFACLLGGCFVVAPHEVVNVPGALAPMLGLKEYG